MKVLLIAVLVLAGAVAPSEAQFVELPTISSSWIAVQYFGRAQSFVRVVYLFAWKEIRLRRPKAREVPFVSG